MRLCEIEAGNADLRHEQQLRINASAMADKAAQLRAKADEVGGINTPQKRYKRPIKPKPPSSKSIKPHA